MQQALSANPGLLSRIGGGIGGAGAAVKGLPWKSLAVRGGAGLMLAPIAGNLVEGLGGKVGLSDELSSVLGSAASGAGIGGAIGSAIPIPGIGTGVGALVGGGIGALGDVLGLWGGDDASVDLPDFDTNLKLLKTISPGAASQAKRIIKASRALPKEQGDLLRQQIQQSLPGLIVQEVQSQQTAQQYAREHARAGRWLNNQLGKALLPYGLGNNMEARSMNNSMVRSFMAQPVVEAYRAQLEAMREGSGGQSLYSLN